MHQPSGTRCVPASAETLSNVLVIGRVSATTGLTKRPIPATHHNEAGNGGLQVMQQQGSEEEMDRIEEALEALIDELKELVGTR